MSLSVSLGSDGNVKQATSYTKTTNICSNKKSHISRSWSTNSKTYNAFSAEFLRRIAEKMAKTLSLVTIKRSSRKVSSSSTLARSRSYADTSLDTQRAEAVEDCIEFLNSSSSLRKSNSVS
ncbi:Sulfoquinovosyldiacylglycerol 2 [Heracleum sosnowskyi]|uniref:Sulfoquinovosyldiacylglycerol 2 n=1 Tax=Heracleum sosnowskyi TaxID=360622 RepID=A0AAD8I3X3_9APIA|nr:Sulfoquinovosyldiacylglycerol 2 [Heracleum sosnowskyi]